MAGSTTQHAVARSAGTTRAARDPHLDPPPFQGEEEDSRLLWRTDATRQHRSPAPAAGCSLPLKGGEVEWGSADSPNAVNQAEVKVSAERTRDHTMYWPPLAVSVEPVMKLASSEARKRTQRATSSGSPRRPSGTSGKMLFSITSFGTALTMSVAI